MQKMVIENIAFRYTDEKWMPNILIALISTDSLALFEDAGEKIKIKTNIKRPSKTNVNR